MQKVAFAASYFAVLHALLNADLQLLFAVGGHNWGQSGHADGKQEKGNSHCTKACENCDTELEILFRPNVAAYSQSCGDTLMADIKIKTSEQQSGRKHGLHLAGEGEWKEASSIEAIFPLIYVLFETRNIENTYVENQSWIE